MQHFNRASKFIRQLIIQKDTSIKMYICIHHFKLNKINNMYHMRISGTEPSSVILSQTK